MNVHEYQAKHLLAAYGLPVPAGETVSTPAEALEAANHLGGQMWVVKAQVHAGGRGKAGGVKLVRSKDEVVEAAKGMLNTRLVTFQTDEKGQPVNQVLVAEPCDIEKELYLSAIIDRARQKVVFMASTEGGVDIEEVAEKTPEKILRFAADPLIGVQPFQCRQIGFKLNLNGTQIKQLTQIITGLYRLMIERDLSLIEINPLIIDDKGNLICLDAKVNVDDNALYRQAEIRQMRDESQEEARENQAQKWELNYIALDGNIGCMVNGAGLAMATMDLIKLKGGQPANFLDVGGSATKERVTEAFKIILSDEQVKGVLINIFGGIVRCDLIADGIIEAVSEVNVTVPVVVRLEGNNAELGAKKLAESGLNIVAAQGFSDAAEKIVSLVNKKVAS